MMSSHFDEKDALSHVIQKRAEGILSLSESHGTEMPGHLSAGADAARESALAFLIIWMLLLYFHLPTWLMGSLLISFACGWVAWKTGRSAWLSWARLERLHRVIEQEKYEIEHHRPQEREELTALYRAKGFEGKLLEEVIDVLMADQDRLLKVMLEEELGLTLQYYEHPLKQAVGALIGTLGAACISGVFFFFLPGYGMPIASALTVGAAACVSACYEKNRLIPAVVWNLAIALLAAGVAYFVVQILT